MKKAEKKQRAALAQKVLELCGVAPKQVHFETLRRGQRLVNPRTHNQKDSLRVSFELYGIQPSGTMVPITVDNGTAFEALVVVQRGHQTTDKEEFSTQATVYMS